MPRKSPIRGADVSVQPNTTVVENFKLPTGYDKGIAFPGLVRLPNGGILALTVEGTNPLLTKRALILSNDGGETWSPVDFFNDREGPFAKNLLIELPDKVQVMDTKSDSNGMPVFYHYETVDGIDYTAIDNPTVVGTVSPVAFGTGVVNGTIYGEYMDLGDPFGGVVAAISKDGITYYPAPSITSGPDEVTTAIVYLKGSRKYLMIKELYSDVNPYPLLGSNILLSDDGLNFNVLKFMPDVSFRKFYGDIEEGLPLMLAPTSSSSEQTVYATYDGHDWFDVLDGSDADAGRRYKYVTYGAGHIVLSGEKDLLTKTYDGLDFDVDDRVDLPTKMQQPMVSGKYLLIPKVNDPLSDIVRIKLY